MSPRRPSLEALDAIHAVGVADRESEAWRFVAARIREVLAAGLLPLSREEIEEVWLPAIDQLGRGARTETLAYIDAADRAQN